MAKQKVRVVLTCAQLAKRGLITLVVLLLVLLVIFGKSTGVIGGPAEISAQLANAGGSLADGADVKMRGIIVGRVSGISRGDAGGVRIGISMNGGELGNIPANVVARILPATVFGTSYVDLTTQGPSSGVKLRAGAVVPADRRQGTLELQKALDDIDTLVKVLQPAKLNTTLSSIAMALDGRGNEIGSMIDDLDHFLTRLGPLVPVIQSDIAKLPANLDIVEQAAPDFFDGVQDTLGPLHTIASHSKELSALLTGGRQVSDQAGALITRVRPDLIRFLDRTATVLAVYRAERHAVFTEAFAAIRSVSSRLISIVRHGWADNTLYMQPAGPGDYTSKDCPRFGSAHGDNCRGGR